MKRSAVLGLSVVGLALGAFACSSNDLPKIEVKPYEKLSGGKSLATVNGTEITDKDMDERVNRSTFQNASEVTADKKKEFLEELISNEVLYQEAKTKHYDEHPRVKMMMVSLLQRDALGTTMDNQTIPDAQTKKYYDTHHDEFVIPEKVRARRILVLFGTDKQAAKTKADDIRKKAMETPNDFGKVALDNSEGPEKSRQGELGYFAAVGRPGLDQKLVTTSFSLKNGEISQVFENEEGWNIVKVENRAPRTERTYDQVKKSIERKLLTDMRKQMLDNYIADLKNKAKVGIDDAAVTAYTPTIAPKPAFNPAMMQQLGQPGMPGMPPGGGPMIVPGPGGNQPGGITIQPGGGSMPPPPAPAPGGR